MPLKLAAKVDRADIDYFQDHIRPLLDHPLVDLIGEIGDGAKSSFLGNARALLFPINWPEPFGMVMIEAMAAGTPVIAYRCGSVMEVVEHGLTGFIVDSQDEAVAAVRMLGELDRRKIRARFIERFSAERMAHDYVELYRMAAQGRVSAGPIPAEADGLEQRGGRKGDLIMTTPGPDALPDPASEFYIPAVGSLTDRRTRTIKHADTFAVFDDHGDILYALGRPDGLFHQDTRYLSRLELLIDGQRPLLLSTTIEDRTAVLSSDLCNPDLYRNGEHILRETLHLARAKFLWNGTCYERLVIRNYSDRPIQATLTIRFGVDFADLFEARGQKRHAARHNRTAAGRSRPCHPGLRRAGRGTTGNTIPVRSAAGQIDVIRGVV